TRHAGSGRPPRRRAQGGKARLASVVSEPRSPSPPRVCCRLPPSRLRPLRAMGSISYREAGVDIDAGDALVERIKPFAKATRIPEVLADVGGFAGLCAVPGGIDEPVLVSGTDGVGTKLKVAFLTGVHDTIGFDLVGMCVNDIIT